LLGAAVGGTPGRLEGLEEIELIIIDMYLYIEQ
jgi:hypothetical protein